MIPTNDKVDQYPMIDALKLAMTDSGIPQEFRAPMIGFFCNRINQSSAIDKVDQSGADERSQDSNIEKNVSLLRDRAKVGLQKYGVSTERRDLSKADWLQHALEEVLDLANYLQAAIAATPQPLPAPAAQSGELPELPMAQQFKVSGDGLTGSEFVFNNFYTAGQMYDYARQAIASQTAPAVAGAAPKYADFANGDAAMWTENGKLKSEWNEAAPQQAVAASSEPAITDEMVKAYLDANDNYWRETDDMTVTDPRKFRKGTPSDATRVSLMAALKASTNQPVQDKSQ